MGNERVCESDIGLMENIKQLIDKINKKFEI